MCWSGELQENYNNCIKLTKVKKIHNFMLNDFREIISQHHQRIAKGMSDWGRFLCKFIFLVKHNWFSVSKEIHITHSFIAILNGE